MVCKYYLQLFPTLPTLALLLLALFFSMHGVSGLRTIKTKYGDIYDCVDIHKQPSMSHPLLKNHKIQLQPDEIVKKAMRDSFRKHKPHKHQLKCPKGTVPIRRIMNEDAFLEQEGVRKGINFAGMHTKGTINAINGAVADLSLWNPKVLDVQSSGARITIQSGQGPQRNYIEAGWTVNPKLYNDRNTRMYTIWTADDLHTTGCYNLRCPGFTVTDRRLALDHVFLNISELRGTVRETHIQIQKDALGNWWFIADFTVGYWPKELFTSLGNGPSEAQWGGQVYIDPAEPFDDPLPIMGTGDVFEGQYAMSAYFSHIGYWDSTNTYTVPDDSMVEYLNEEWCYFASYDNYSNDKGFNFLYGGPDIQSCQGGA